MDFASNWLRKVEATTNLQLRRVAVMTMMQMIIFIATIRPIMRTSSPSQYLPRNDAGMPRSRALKSLRAVQVYMCCTVIRLQDTASFIGTIAPEFEVRHGYHYYTISVNE